MLHLLLLLTIILPENLVSCFRVCNWFKSRPAVPHIYIYLPITAETQVIPMWLLSGIINIKSGDMATSRAGLSAGCQVREGKAEHGKYEEIMSIRKIRRQKKLASLILCSSTQIGVMSSHQI